MVLPLPAGAGQSPDGPTRDIATERAATQWRPSLYEAIDPGQLAERARFEQVSLSEAEWHFRNEALAVLVQEEAQQRWPEEFAGVWVDHDRDFAPTVAFTTDADAKIEEISKVVAGATSIEGVQVSHSLRDLEAAATKIVADARSARDGSTAGIPSTLASTGGEIGVGVDIIHDGLGIDVDDPSPAMRSELSRQYGIDVAVSKGTGAPAACTIDNCGNKINGGIRFDGSGGSCSTGFAAYNGTSRFILSAGHCTPGSPGVHRWHNGSYYGSTTQYGGAWQFSGRTDAERVGLASGGYWDHSNLLRIRVNNVEQTLPITSWISNGSIVTGTYVGRSGATTNTHFGYITQTGYTPTWVPSATASYIKAGVCVDYGDSGGPVFSNTTAYGIVSGGITGATCGSSSAWSAFTTIQYALTDMNVALETSNFNDAPRAAFTWNCFAILACSFNGTGSFDPEGAIVSYSWNFGDGNTGSGAYVNHQYLLPGTVTVALTVTDVGGKTWTVTHPVNVVLL